MATQQQSLVLLTSDQSASVLKRLEAQGSSSISYSPFGHATANEPGTVCAFNGQVREHLLPIYLLGHGYRAFDTVLRRFHSPDSLSPFAEGGLNCYVYCLGDPVNQTDPDGHTSIFRLRGPVARRIAGKNLSKTTSKAKSHLLHVPEISSTRSSAPPPTNPAVAPAQAQAQNTVPRSPASSSSSNTGAASDMISDTPSRSNLTRPDYESYQRLNATINKGKRMQLDMSEAEKARSILRERAARNARDHNASSVVATNERSLPPPKYNSLFNDDGLPTFHSLQFKRIIIRSS